MSARLIWGLIAAAVLMVLGAVFLGGPIIGFVKDRWMQAEAKAETATDAGVALDTAGRGAADINRRAIDLVIQVDQAQQRTQELRDAALQDPEGEEPLPPASVDRLRRHDQWLCDRSPALCADQRPAAAGDQPGGSEAVQPLSAPE